MALSSIAFWPTWRGKLSLGHASLTTTERYLGIRQELHDAPCDYLKLDLAAEE